MARWLSIALKSVLTVGVVAALFAAVDPTALLSSLRRAEWVWVAGAAALLPLNLFLDGWVWKRLLDTILDRVPPRSLVGALLSGLALGFWTPARIGEYAGRAFYLPDGDRWSISLTVFAQRMVDMTVGVTVGFVVLLGAFASAAIPLTTAWAAAAAVGLGTGAVLVVFIVAPGLVHRLARWLAPNRPAITDRTAFFQRLTRRQGGAVVGGSLARYLVFTGQFVCLGMAFAPSASWPLVAVAASLTFYAKYLIPSLTVLDLGLREGGAAFFFHTFGLGAAAGLSAALVLFAINVLVPAALGLPLVGRLRLAGAHDPAASPVRTASSGP